MYDFLFVIIELFSLALTVEALQGKTCQDSLLSGGGRSVWTKISGGGVVPGEYFMVSTKLDTFCYLTVQTAPCYVPSFWHNTGVWQMDRHRDGIAIASTVLAMRALRRAVKTVTIWKKFLMFYSTCAEFASAVLATAIPSVCPSVTRRYCVKTTARSMVQFPLSDSKLCLVL